MNKRTIALLPTDQRDPDLTLPFTDAVAAESRPDGRVSSVPVVDGNGCWTIAATGDWALAVAMSKVAVCIALRQAAT